MIFRRRCSDPVDRDFDGSVAQLNLLAWPFVVARVEPVYPNQPTGVHVVIGVHPHEPGKTWVVGHTDGPLDEAR